MAHMAPKVTTWIVLLIVSCSKNAVQLAQLAMLYGLWGSVVTVSQKKTPDRYSLELWQIHLCTMASHIRKWSRFDTMMFTYMYFGHYLALTHFSTNVPMPMLL